MDNTEFDVRQWADEQLASLNAAGEWQPNGDRAWARLRERGRAAAVKRRRWAWAMAAAAICAGALVLPIPPRACATPRVCARNLWEAVFPPPIAKPAEPLAGGGAPPTPGTTAAEQPLRSGEPANTPEPRAPAAAATVGRDFKEYGSENAPLTCEIYSDFQCPACARFHDEVVPLLVTEYVQTGKMKLIYHDLPLTRIHPYAGLAARYADAAGMAGYYDEAVKQIFKTQSIWSEAGDVDGQLAQALPPDAMLAVRALVKGDASLDEGLAADVAKGNEDGINGTPTMVIVANGKRQAVGGGLSWDLLKSFLDGLLERSGAEPAVHIP